MFHYFTPPPDFSRDKTSRVATMTKNIGNVRDLLTAAGVVLNFPPFYGKNFDAFWDCIRDIDLPQHKIVLLNQDLPQLPEDDLETWITLLRDATLYWRRHSKEHVFEVWFPENAAEKIEAVLKDAPAPDEND